MFLMLKWANLSLTMKQYVPQRRLPWIPFFLKNCRYRRQINAPEGVLFLLAGLWVVSLTYPLISRL
jgi:hypothetical protein